MYYNQSNIYKLELKNKGENEYEYRNKNVDSCCR